MGIIGWIIIGLIAGWLASMVMGRGGYGLVGDIIVGLIGALIGGFIVQLIPGLGGAIDFGTSGFWTSLVVAFIGAVVLIFLARTLTKGRTSL
jgi:uncharacterized membrane protein YeaQ/YmgE (transglycosylase-associated protein family)